MKRIIALLFFIWINSFSQTLIFENEFGNFSSASAFDIDLKKNFYITDGNSNTITKLDSSGNLILSVGGFGWNELTFDEPTDVFTNSLSVYIADKNNNRIQRLDKDLNFLSQFNGNSETSDVEFGYPTTIAISNLGDLFILDSDNSRILKYNLTGEYLFEIGGVDAGEFAINNPKNFTLDRNGNLYVLDGDIIKIFDQYGNGILKFTTKGKIEKIKEFANNLWYISKNSLKIFDLRDRKIKSSLNSLPNLNDETIEDIIYTDKYLFLLTPKRIIKYRFIFTP